MADPRIQLTAYLPNNTRPNIGDLVLGDPMPMNRTIKFSGQYLPGDYGTRLERFIDLRMHIMSSDNRPTTWGVVDCAVEEAVQLSPARGYNGVSFTWHLTHADLDEIERHRAGERYINFNILVEGLAFVAGATGNELHPVRGNGQLQLSVTEWEDKVLGPLGYKLPESWDRLLPQLERRAHPDGRRLRSASRRRVRHFDEVSRATRLGRCWTPLKASLPSPLTRLSGKQN